MKDTNFELLNQKTTQPISMPIHSRTIWCIETDVVVTLTTASRYSDALVHLATAVHHFHADALVVVRHRLRKGRVANVWTAVSAAIVVEAVETPIVIRWNKKRIWFFTRSKRHAIKTQVPILDPYLNKCLTQYVGQVVTYMFYHCSIMQCFSIIN